MISCEVYQMSIIRKYLWNIILRVDGNTLRNLASLSKWQWLDSEASVSLQQQRLKKLLIHAYNNVPYHRRILSVSHTVSDSGDVNLRAFSDVPFLTKDTILANFAELQSSDISRRKVYTNTSGGSTGEPVLLVQDKDYRDWVRAGAMLFNQWAGYTSGSKMVKLWGSERDLFVGHETLMTNFVRWARNELWLNAFRMTTAQMGNYVYEINRVQPTQILAYVESIYDLARYIEKNEINVFSPRAIMSSAGKLNPEMRNTIERVFRSPVFDRYGSREAGDVACQCDHLSGLHVCMPIHYVEIVNSDGDPVAPGESGELVLTILTNYAMPLIRYRIGDLAIWANHDCTCKRTWPLLKEITGRITDLFIRRDGTQIHGEYFTHLFYYRDWIKKFQVVQESFDLVRVLIVPIKELDSTVLHQKEIAEIADKIRFVMGVDCKVEFEFLEIINPSVSGKYRYTISKVAALNSIAT